MIRMMAGGLAAASLAMMSEAWAEESTWSGEVEAGAVMTSGNTETQTLNGKAKVVNERAPWRHTFRLEALNTADGESTTAEKYGLSLRSRYSLGEFRFAFASVAYEDDRFSGYDYQVTEAVGYGMRVIRRETLFLDVEFGPGARQSELNTGGSQSEFIFRLAGDLEWQVNDTSKFTQTLSTEIGEEQTVSKSETALTSALIGHLALKVSLNVKHTSSVPVGVDNTDSELAVNLLYKF